MTPDRLAPARALGPIHEREGFGHRILLFDRAERERVAALGQVRTPSLEDLFLALLGGER